MAELPENVKDLALNCGFSHVGELDVNSIRLRTEVRDMCAADKCNRYGKSWSCPPACGTLEECGALIKKYSRGIILQTTGEIDTMDWEAIEGLSKLHHKNMENFAEKIRALYPSSLVIGAGVCADCEKCTYPDVPCRFPDKLSYKMEGLGMLVSDVCQDNDLPYYYGAGTLTYVGCALIY
jgi:predicted metal-binding protein